MPVCSAPNCSNRPENGIRLFRLPSDEERRRWWMENSGRKNWQPTESSRFCEDADSLAPAVKPSDGFEDAFPNNEDCDFFPSQQTDTVMRQIPNVAQWVVDHAYVKETVDHIRQNNSSPTEVRKENQNDKQTDQEGKQVSELDHTVDESLRGLVIQRNHEDQGWRQGVLGLRIPVGTGDLNETKESDASGDSSKERDGNESQQNFEIGVVGVKSLHGKGSTKYYIKGTNTWKHIRDPVVQLTPLAPIRNETEELNFLKPIAGQTFSLRGFRNGASGRRGRGRGRRGRGRGRGADTGIVREQDVTGVTEPVTQGESTEAKTNIEDNVKKELMDVEEQQMELTNRMQQALPLTRGQRTRGRRGRPRGRGRGSVNVFTKILGAKSVGATSSSHVGLLRLLVYRKRGRPRGRGRSRETFNAAGTETGIMKEGSGSPEDNTVKLIKSEIRLNEKRGGVFIGLSRRGGRRRGRGFGRGVSVELRASERLKDLKETIDSNATLSETIIHSVHTSEPNNVKREIVDVNPNGIVKEMVGRGGLWGRRGKTRGRKRSRGRSRGRGRSEESGRERQRKVHLREAESSEDSEESSIFGSNGSVMDSRIDNSLYGEGCKYPCPFCGMAFATHFYVEVHGRLCAMAPGKGAYSCEDCDRLYMNADDLAAHKFMHVV